MLLYLEHARYIHILPKDGLKSHHGDFRSAVIRSQRLKTSRSLSYPLLGRHFLTVLWLQDRYGHRENMQPMQFVTLGASFA